MPLNRHKEIKEQAYEANMEIFRRGLAVYTFGNASAFDPEKGVFAIKPSGVPYAELTSGKMVVVDLENNVVEGSLNPSSDTRTHSTLYRGFKCIGGVAHTHSPYASAWAQAMEPVPILGTTHADCLPSDIPCTAVMSDEMIKGDYEEETGNQILELFRNLSPGVIKMALVARHGPFTWGETAAEAAYNSVMLEELAKIALLTRQISPEIKRIKKSLIDKHYERKHGDNAYYGQ